MTSSHPQERAQPPNEDDFEFVHSQAHETDDLSSLASCSGHTDNESNADQDDSQAQSDVTLQMPSVDHAAGYLQEADRSMTHDTAQARRDLLASKLGLYVGEWYNPAMEGYDRPGAGRVKLPILYLGNFEHKDAILTKLANHLLPEVTIESPFHSETGVLESVVSCKDSSVVFEIYTDLAKAKQARELAMAVLVGDEARESLSALLAMFGDYDDLPILLLAEEKETDKTSSIHDSTTEKHGQHANLPTTSSAGLLNYEGKPRLFQPLHIDEFLALSSDDLRDPILNCFDLWYIPERPATDFSKSLESVRNTRWFFAFSLCFLTLALVIPIIHSSLNSHRLVWQHETRPFPSSNSSSSAITFHQITETNAIIELPLRLRSVETAKVPKIVASVSRDGKAIESRVQLIVDNLYSLDWAHSEAHGELLVAAELTGSKEKLTDAYVVQYSTSTSFLHAVTEKLRDLNHLGHLTPDVDLTRRVHDLVKQVEESRSYAVKASKHQLEALKEHGSLGFKRLQKDYSAVLHDASKNLKSAYNAGKKLSESAKWQAMKRVEMARHGIDRLRSKHGWYGVKPGTKKGKTIKRYAKKIKKSIS